MKDKPSPTEHNHDGIMFKDDHMVKEERPPAEGAALKAKDEKVKDLMYGVEGEGTAEWASTMFWVATKTRLPFRRWCGLPALFLLFRRCPFRQTRRQC